MAQAVKPIDSAVVEKSKINASTRRFERNRLGEEN